MGITAGIVVEYNPFHNGHAYHLEQTIRATGAETIVAVMSGNWLQRGEPALVSKRARTEMAVAAGIDLVIELPVAYSTQPAEWFAFGAISALEATGVVDAVCFGSELGDADALMAVAERMRDEPDIFRDIIREQLKKGVPYPAAYASAVQTLSADQETARLLAQPNNSLGFHYLLSLFRMGSAIRPYTIQRVKAGYSQADISDESIASATAIRKLLLRSERPDRDSLCEIASYVPNTTLAVLQREIDEGRGPVHWERYRLPLLHRLLVQPAEQLAAYREVTEGLEYRIKKALSALDRPATVERLLEALKTKRYTRTKLQRMLTSIYLEHRKDQFCPDTLRNGVPYLRVLGFSERGRALLKRMKRTARVPVLTGVGRRDAHPMLSLDTAATAAYVLGYPSAASACADATDWNGDFYASPVQPPSAEASGSNDSK
ncbi:nucleotidyltransferase [Paenibacillus alkalitolerans]|uniref:nucleotidyltransferase n=1 Tax=Paenibacillus alkalitolerans TaxID=2799335 RepID=UPI0018F5D201|nr:nucleotidyltransferase [Paenibacillus alkalitolerans]